jgi:hypothetical protein
MPRAEMTIAVCNSGFSSSMVKPVNFPRDSCRRYYSE